MEKLKRTMGIWQLSAFGINYMVPISSAVVFGIMLEKAGGSVALGYLLAGIAMLFIANSYMLMAKEMPSCGSLYSFISKGLNPHVGFISGWVLLLDYIFIPTLATVSSVLFLKNLITFGSFEFWYCSFIIITCITGIIGINLLARLGLLLLLIVGIVVVSGLFIWAYAVGFNGVGTGTLISSTPFQFSSLDGLVSAAAIGAFSYLGFDAITTMSEETINPRKNVPKAIMISIVVIGSLMFLIGYVGMLVIPDWENFINDSHWVNTTLFYVSKITGGESFATFYTIGFILSQIVFVLVANTASSRLLYAMGRDGVLPKSIFGRIHKKYKTPHLNLIVIMIIQIILGLVLNLESLAQIVNFGALIGFTLLTFTVIYFYFKNKPDDASIIRHLILPIFGIAFMLWLLSGLSIMTYIIGSLWLALGLVFGFIKTNGYKEKIVLYK